MGIRAEWKNLSASKGQTLPRPMGGQATAPEEESLLLSHLPLERQDNTDARRQTNRAADGDVHAGGWHPRNGYGLRPRY